MTDNKPFDLLHFIWIWARRSTLRLKLCMYNELQSVLKLSHAAKMLRLLAQSRVLQVTANHRLDAYIRPKIGGVAAGCCCWEALPYSERLCIFILRVMSRNFEPHCGFLELHEFMCVPEMPPWNCSTTVQVSVAECGCQWKVGFWFIWFLIWRIIDGRCQMQMDLRVLPFVPFLTSPWHSVGSHF